MLEGSSLEKRDIQIRMPLEGQTTNLYLTRARIMLSLMMGRSEN